MSRELDAYIRIGERVNLGSHRFTAQEIIEFAKEFDPQEFHVNPAKAANSLLGGLCASGWHTCAMWMRYNYAERERANAQPWEGEHPRPELGPSPGFKNLRWMKPVFAGSTITFYRTATSYRELATRPGWMMLQLKSEAINADGEQVMEMDNAVLFKYSPNEANSAVW